MRGKASANKSKEYAECSAGEQLGTSPFLKERKKAPPAFFFFFFFFFFAKNMQVLDFHILITQGNTGSISLAQLNIHTVK